MRAKAQLIIKRKILSKFVEFRGLHHFRVVKFFLGENLDEVRLIYFILDKLEILCYTLITIKERTAFENE